MQYVYDPTKVILTVGPVAVTGYAEGTFIEIEADDDNTTFGMGAVGDVQMTVKPFNQIGTIKFTLMQGSPANAALTALYETRRLPGFKGYPIALLNLLGSEAAAIELGAIIKPPQQSFADGVMTRQWTCKGQLKQLPIGSTPVSLL